MPNYAWFPTTAIVSLLFVLVEGRSSELAMVGNDGVAGARGDGFG